MPRIKEYSPQTQAAGPFQTRRATGEDIGFGSSIVKLGEGIGQVGEFVQKRQEQSELSDARASIAKLHADKTNKWQESLRTADPADKELSTRFLQEVDDDLSVLGEKYSTPAARNYFENASAGFKSHFGISAVSGQAELAREKTIQDHQQTLSSYSSSLLQDPSGLPLALSDLDGGVDALVTSAGLDRQTAIKLKGQGAPELVKSAVLGWTKLDPAGTKKRLESGEWNSHLNAEQTMQLVGEADQEIRGREAERIRQEADYQKRLKVDQMNTENNFLDQIQKGTLDWPKIRDSNLDPRDKEHFMNLMKSESEKPTRTDPGTFRKVWDDIHREDGDPLKIVDERALDSLVSKGRLSVTDLMTLRGEIQGKRTEEGGIESTLKKGLVDIAKGQLTSSNPLLGIRDPKGDEQFQKYMAYFLTEYKTQRQSGKTPQDLLNPDSKDYLGKQIGKFVRSPQEILKGMTEAAQGTPPEKAVPPRGEGESAADYLKRIKGGE